jgi:hypothetical protein
LETASFLDNIAKGQEQLESVASAGSGSLLEVGLFVCLKVILAPNKK